MRHTEITAKDLAARAGVPRTAAANYLNGRPEKAGRAACLAIKQALGLKRAKDDHTSPQARIYKAWLSGRELSHFDGITEFGTNRLSMVALRFRWSFMDDHKQIWQDGYDESLAEFVAKNKREPRVSKEWTGVWLSAVLLTVSHPREHGAAFGTYVLRPSVLKALRAK